MERVLGEVVERIRKEVREGRELFYGEGEVGITSLLSCPLKVELKRRYPEVEVEAVEVDEGFLWEKQVKPVLRSVVEEMGGVFEEEKELVDEVEGVKVRGHLDCFVEFPKEVWGIELKSPKLLLLKKLPESFEGVFWVDEEGLVLNNPLYLLQARVQKHLLKKLYPNKEVKQFLFYKAPVKRGRYERKLYVLVPVKEDLSEEEYRELLRRFQEDKSPRYPSECSSYCEFFRRGLCEGKEFRYEDGDLDGETRDLLREYRELQSQIKQVENLLKKRIKGEVKVGDAVLGWVRRKVVKVDEGKVLQLLPTERIPEFFQLKGSKKEELVKELGESVVEEVREERVWKL